MISAGNIIEPKNVCRVKLEDDSQEHVKACHEAVEQIQAACSSEYGYIDEMSCADDEMLATAWDADPESDGGAYIKTLKEGGMSQDTYVLVQEAKNDGTWNGKSLTATEEAEEVEETEEPEEEPIIEVKIDSDVLKFCKADKECAEIVNRVVDKAKEEGMEDDAIKAEYLTENWKDSDYDKGPIRDSMSIKEFVYVQGVAAGEKPPEEDEDDESGGKMGVADGVFGFGGGLGYISATIDNAENDFGGRSSKLKGFYAPAFLELYVGGLIGKDGKSINGFNFGIGAGYAFNQMENFVRDNDTSVNTPDTHSMDVYALAEYAFTDWIGMKARLGLNVQWSEVMAGTFGAVDQTIPAFKGQLGISVAPVRTEHFALVVDIMGVLLAGATQNQTAKDEDLSLEREFNVDSKVLGGGIYGGVTFKFNPF